MKRPWGTAGIGLRTSPLEPHVRRGASDNNVPGIGIDVLRRRDIGADQGLDMGTDHPFFGDGGDLCECLHQGIGIGGVP
jgi:hypothetical protein